MEAKKNDECHRNRRHWGFNLIASMDYRAFIRYSTTVRLHRYYADDAHIIAELYDNRSNEHEYSWQEVYLVWFVWMGVRARTVCFALCRTLHAGNEADRPAALYLWHMYIRVE